MKRSVMKLVRDNIPAICKENGQTPETRILDNIEYTSELRKKLKEEVDEYLSSTELEELADIVEVIDALAENQGSSLEAVLDIKQAKRCKNGAFQKKIFMISVDDLT